MLVFVEGGKTKNPEKKPSKQRREPTTNSIPHVTARPGIEPRSAITTAPFLLPYIPFKNYPGARLPPPPPRHPRGDRHRKKSDMEIEAI